MILDVLTALAYIGGALFVAAIPAGLWLLYCGWRDHHRDVGFGLGADIGYGHGSLDGFRAGDARGYTRGYSQACLDHVLATPDEAQHYAGVVSAIPDAEHFAASWDAVRLGSVRRSVQGKESQS